jgi:hypothetical protein
MAFVPGFEHDVFISYAHGDDRDWINRFLDRLKPALSRLLPGADVWVDTDDLRKSRNFEQDIPASLGMSAVLISLVSPIYITRPYCVQQEYRRFRSLSEGRKQAGQRFAAAEFAADLFGFRCPIVPLLDDSYRNSILPGASDIAFCDDISAFPIGSAPFEEQFRVLLREMRALLLRMRNHATPVFVYPPAPAADLTEAHAALTRELHAQSYRVLPGDELDPFPSLNRSELAVLLLGAAYDQSETTRQLAEQMAKLDKPFVIWPAPSLDSAGDATQRGFFQYLVDLESPRKTLLRAAITPEKLKEEVLAILNPRAKMPPPVEGKPRVYLVYDSAKTSEKNNAGKIVFQYKDDFHFDLSDNPRQHSLCLTQSDGVLLVWGEAKEDWCAAEFEQMVRLASKAKARGLCLFDPKESKAALADQIGADHSVSVATQFGAFDRARLEPFFAPIRRLPEAGA